MVGFCSDVSIITAPIGAVFVTLTQIGDIMNITAVKTPKLVAGTVSLFEVLDDALPTISEGSIVAITSKIVSICEGSVMGHADITKDDLVIRESDQYVSAALSAYNFHFTVTNHTLIPMAGVDESNGDGHYILWPRDAQATANSVRKYLADKHGLTQLGVIITDSTSRPLRRGTSGIALAHSGFKATRDYVGTPDLFGRPFGVTLADVSGGLAAAAVLAMGEGTEQTPLCVLSDMPSIDFQTGDPSPDELAERNITIEDDLFAPFLTAVEWHKGSRGESDEQRT